MWESEPVSDRMCVSVSLLVSDRMCVSLRE